MNVQNDLATIEGDPGTGNLIGDPLAEIHLFHFRTPLPVRDPLPHILRTGPEKVATPPADGPGAAPGGGPGLPWQPLAQNPEGSIESQAGLGNAGSWADAVKGFGPSSAILAQLGQSAGNGGANLQLGPQAGFAPAATTTTSGGGGGMGLFLVLALAIVGGLAYYHFRHKKPAEAKKD